jgi:hypothetical protein
MLTSTKISKEEFDLLQKDHCNLIIENKILRQEVQHLINSNVKLRNKLGYQAEKILEPLRYF